MASQLFLVSVLYVLASVEATSLGCPYVDRSAVLCAGPIPETCPKPCGPSQRCCPTACGMECKSLGFPQPPTPPQNSVCPKTNPNIQCIWFNEQCNDSNKPCGPNQVCCGDNCGTQCIAVSKPPTKPPTSVCPAPDGKVCVWFNEQCNDYNKPCGPNQICCKDNCGSQCVNTAKPPTWPQYPQMPANLDWSYIEQILNWMRPYICRQNFYRG